MKHLSTLLSLLLLPVVSWGQGIDFQDGTWDEAKATAKKEGKPIFLDTYTTWCGPCKLMDKNLFPDKKVGEFFNSTYISYKMDIEKGDGIEFAKQHKIRSIPTLFFFSPEGEMIHRSMGRPVDNDAFIQIGKDALNPKRSLSALHGQFDTGNREPEFLYTYAVVLDKAEEPTDKVVDLYLKTQKKADWSNKINWELISKGVEDFESEAFQYVAGNQEPFRATAGDQLEQFLFWTLKGSINDLLEDKDEARKMKLEETVRVALPGKAEAMLAKLNYRYYQDDPKKGHACAVAYLDHHASKWRELNSAAWRYYESESDSKRLEAALGWVERSIEIDKNYANIDTRAALLFKLKRYQEAREVAQESIEVGKQSGAVTEHAEKLIEKIFKAAAASGSN